MNSWPNAHNQPHVVEILCTCPDPDQCATSALAADRNSGWKEAWRIRSELERLRAQVEQRGPA
jgi:hypothetical protein